MAKKKVSDTIEQQRKARAEFLKLKQMQMGEIAPEPKPSEVACAPKTVGEKIANIWFHYKYVIIFGTLIAALLTFLVVQCANKVESDLDIVYCSYVLCMDNEIAEMEEYFEQYAKDLNGDGEIKVTVINCSYSPENASFEYKNSILQKLQATLAANPKAMLFITDSESMKYFDNLIVNGGVFEGEPKLLKDEFFANLDDSEFGEYLPRDLQISIRRVEGTQMEQEKGSKENFVASKELLKSVAK